MIIAKNASFSSQRPAGISATSARLGIIILAAAFLSLIRLGSTASIIGSPLRPVYFAVLVAGGLMAVWGPGLLIAELVSKRDFAKRMRIALSLVAAALVAWSLFWAYFVSPSFGIVASLIVFGSTIVGLAARPQAVTNREIAHPLLFAALIALTYLFLAGDHGGFQAGSTQIAHRYWVTVDSKIPQIFADQIMLGRDALLAANLPTWQLGDRPPLQTAMILTSYPFVTLVPGETEWLKFRGVVYIPLGIAVNVVWVVALWGFLRSFRLPESQIGIVIVAVAAVGAVYLNTVFAWPKMLGAAMVLVAAGMLLAPRATTASRTILAMSASALALLAHGALVFGLIGLAPLAYRAMHRWRLSFIAVGMVAMCAIYAPWIGYQKLFDPPSDRLAKWHLGGTSIETIDPRPAFEAIKDRYVEAGVIGTLHNKLANFRVLLGDPTIEPLYDAQPAWTDYPVRVLRNYLSHRMFPAPGLLLFGVLFVLFDARLRREIWVKPVLSIVALSTLAYGLIEFGAPKFAVAWLHVAPYSLLLLWCAAGAIALVRHGSLPAKILLAAHFVSFYVVWIFGVSTKSALGWEAMNEPFDLGMATGALICACAIALLIYRMSSASAHPSSPRAVRP